MVILLACVFCWVLLCKTTRLFYYIIYLGKFVHKKYIFFLDFWLPDVYLLFNVNIIFYLNYTSVLIGEACFV